MSHFRKIIIVLSCAVVMFLCGCAARQTSVQCVIGVSLADMREQWRLVLKDELEAEAAKYPGVRLVIADSAGDSKKQASDIKRLISYGINLLIISPGDVEALTPIINETFEDIPVIILDRAVEDCDYSLFIGPDNNLIGWQAGRSVIKLLDGDEVDGASVLELKSGSYASEERSAEFAKALAEANVSTFPMNLPEATRDCAEDALLEHPEVLKGIHVIFAHNDYMAYGAYLAMEKLNIQGIKIVGLDGFSGEKGGLQLVKQGIIDATVTCPTGGTEAIQYAIDMIREADGIPKQIILRSYRIDAENVEEYLQREQASSGSSVIRVGYVQTGEESDWRRDCTESICQAAKEFNVDLMMEETQPFVEKQVESVQKLIDQDADVIVISPVAERGWLNVLTKAQEAGIPIILVDRMAAAEESLYTSFIGADFEREGRLCAQWLVDELPGQQQVHILELCGEEWSLPMRQRKNGFEAILSEEKNFKIVHSVFGESTKEGGYLAIQDYLNHQDRNIDVIYAHNNEMASGAIKALEELGIQPGIDVKIVSMDGAEGNLDALQAGKINCVVECTPYLGAPIMKAVTDLMQGKELPLRIITMEEILS